VTLIPFVVSSSTHGRNQRKTHANSKCFHALRIFFACARESKIQRRRNAWIGGSRDRRLRGSLSTQFLRFRTQRAGSIAASGRKENADYKPAFSDHTQWFDRLTTNGFG
jgi:hypothetical protein